MEQRRPRWLDRCTPDLPLRLPNDLEVGKGKGSGKGESKRTWKDEESPASPRPPRDRRPRRDRQALRAEDTSRSPHPSSTRKGSRDGGAPSPPSLHRSERIRTTQIRDPRRRVQVSAFGCVASIVWKHVRTGREPPPIQLAHRPSLNPPGAHPRARNDTCVAGTTSVPEESWRNRPTLDGPCALRTVLFPKR